MDKNNIPRYYAWRLEKSEKGHSRGVYYSALLLSFPKTCTLNKRVSLAQSISKLVFKYLLLVGLLLNLTCQGFCSTYIHVVNAPGKKRADLPGAAFATTTVPYFHLELAKDTVNTDNTLIRFMSNAPAKFSSDFDAPYFPGFGQVSLSSFSSDRERLTINTQPYPKTSEIIGLEVIVKSTGTYTLTLKDIVNMPPLFEVWLMDACKKDSVNLLLTKSYSFNINLNDTSTFGQNRFWLVIRQNPAYAYRLINFSAVKSTDSAKTAKQVQVAWQTKNEQSYTSFMVERSNDDGKTFAGLDSLRSNSSGTYSFTDKNPSTGQNIYRLKMEDISDSISYSSTVFISYSDLTQNLLRSNISVYPNPAQANIAMHITAPDSTGAVYSITITNSSGLLIKQVTSSDANWKGNVSDLMPGTYIISVSNYKNKSLVGYTKFLKM